MRRPPPPVAPQAPEIAAKARAIDLKVMARRLSGEIGRLGSYATGRFLESKYSLFHASLATSCSQVPSSRGWHR